VRWEEDTVLEIPVRNEYESEIEEEWKEQ
jgi:hypothetical protein